MYHWLLPVDANEERAMTQAEYLTGLPHPTDECVVTVLYVFDKQSADAGEHVPATATRVGSVKRVSEHLEEHGLDTTVIDDSVETVDAILRYATENDADEIVLGGRKRSPAGKALFGSVTQSVILNTDLPVTVTGRSSE